MTPQAGSAPPISYEHQGELMRTDYAMIMVNAPVTIPSQKRTYSKIKQMACCTLWLPRHFGAEPFYERENKDTRVQSHAITMQPVFFSPLHRFSLIRIAQLVERKEANWKTRVTLKFSPESIYSAELIRSRGDNGANTVKHLGEWFLI